MTPEERIAHLEAVVAELVKSDRYIFHKNLQLLDGRKIQLGRTTGTMLGTAADQKLGFFGATPVVQQTAPATAAGIIASLKTFGLYIP